VAPAAYVVVSVLASLKPAARAPRIDPVGALRV
jgi:ABC-type lipoprotein release transport system permease subunit